jgi:hypothetical protein
MQLKNGPDVKNFNLHMGPSAYFVDEISSVGSPTMQLFKAPPGFFASDQKQVTMNQLRKSQSKDKQDSPDLVSPKPNSKTLIEKYDKQITQKRAKSTQ